MIALVTGASSGIGAATARRLAVEPDTRLVLVARRRERLEGLAAELGGATVIAADLVEEATPALVAERVEAEHGRLDLLVNNAGIRGRGGFAEGGWVEVKQVMATNFDAPVRLTEALLPLLRRSAPSGIVNVGSVAGRVSRPRAGAYSASKFALAGWTEALQMEEVPHGVHVALVQPGFVDTEGLPQRKMLARPWTRWMVSSEDKVGRGDPRCLARAPIRALRAPTLRADPDRPGPAARPVPPGGPRRHLHHHGQARLDLCPAQLQLTPGEGGQALGLGLGGAPGPGGERPGERLDGDLPAPALGLLAPDALHAAPDQQHR
jgi:short-subunit dehydrogenase